MRFFGPGRATSSPVDNDQTLLRRAGRNAAFQTALILSVFLTLVGLIAYFLTVHNQNGQIDTQLSAVVAIADDVVDPPPGVALAIQPANGSLAMSSRAPAATAQLVSAPLGYSSVDEGGRRYRALVADRSGTRVVALLDLSPWESARRQLLLALAVAELAGLVAIGIVVMVLSRRAIRPLATALDLQRRFVADASHELRAPLTLLHTRAQILARIVGKQELGENVSKGLEGLVADTRALGDVVDDLLLAASLEAGTAPRQRERVDLLALAEEVLAAAAARAQSLGIALAIDDAAASGAVVMGSTSALRRALIALVDNALRYEKPGGRVVMRPMRTGTTVEIAVIDTGAGLDPQTAGELFNRFAYGDGHTAEGRHYGLGLALVREIVHDHDGHITVTGEPGRGATFTLSFPAFERDSAR